VRLSYLACRTESPVQLELATNSQLAISLPALAVLLRRKMPIRLFVFSREGNLHLQNRKLSAARLTRLESAYRQSHNSHLSANQ
jgi:hypothetical protein